MQIIKRKLGRINRNEKILEVRQNIRCVFCRNNSSKTITFFLLPIYTKYISPKDMGTYDLHLAYITFLCSVLFLNIWCGIMRYTFEYTDEEKKKPITSGVAIFLCSTVLYTIVFAVVWKVGNVPYLGWIYLYGILSNIQTLLGYLTRCFGKKFPLCNIRISIFLCNDYFQYYLYRNYGNGLFRTVYFILYRIFSGNFGNGKRCTYYTVCFSRSI